MTPAAAPKVLDGRYRLGEVLGRGGMGEVRAGVDLRLGRAVAVKVLRPDLSSDAELRRRFESEARAAARISHPHAVAVYDAGEDDGVAYLVMERLPGATLADEVATGPLDEQRACSLAAQVLAALDVAHHRGLVHRDIKPANVLVAADGTAKLADFGIAKVLEDGGDATTGFVLGTPAYLAPERLSGQPATPASDLYAVGVVLYEALSGRKPFHADTPFAVVHAVHQGGAEPLGRLRPDVHPAVVAAVERAMDPDPARRHPSAAAFAAALGGGATAVGAPANGEEEGATVRLPHAATARVERPLGPSPAPRWLRLRPSKLSRLPPWSLVVVAVALVAAVALVVDTRREGPPSEELRPPTTSASGSPTLPEPLERAVRELEEELRR